MNLRSVLVAFSVSALSISPTRSTDLPAQLLPVYGGAGGTAFSRSCGAGMVMTGIRYRAGMLVDAVGLLCRPVTASGRLGSETTVGTLVGGGGGTFNTMSCPNIKVVIGLHIDYGTYVDRIRVFCANWIVATRKFSPTTGSYPYGGAGNPLGVASSASVECEAHIQPAQGIRGRAHSLLDAIGLVCDEP